MRDITAKTIGIVAHSDEGGALCFITACREGAAQMGVHMHPNIVLSAVPMGLSMEAWESDDYDTIARHLTRGVQMVADAGAHFYICPDNTAHIVLERIAAQLPLPGLHIAEVVCAEITGNNWRRVGLLGTKWTMTGPIYAAALARRGLEQLTPEPAIQTRLNSAILDELCQGSFTAPTTQLFLQAIDELKARGAECVILGCTEIPLIVTPENSALPVVDSTRLLAKSAVRTALNPAAAYPGSGWLPV
ncbi:MAG TPA: amino acid racemase [Steroidobacteraceae bacterium]|nr:amino acid racemase [Steroidobacteraceae bacterium]